MEHRTGIGLTFLSIGAGLLIAAASIVATAPAERGQDWTSPIVLGLLLGAGGCILIAFGFLGVLGVAWAGSRSLVLGMGRYLPRVRVRVSWRAPERSLGRLLHRPILLRTTSRLVVSRATYGSETKKIDVTSRLNGLIENDRLDFTVDNKTMGEDPHPGVPKMLSVEWVADGQRFPRTFAEGTHVTIPD